MVDDEPEIRRLNTKALTRSGFAVTALEDGEVAWKALNAERYDLLITDYNMPKVTGLDLLKLVGAARMELPVILASGNLPDEELTAVAPLQPAATLAKPYTIAQLIETVKAVLRSAGERGRSESSTGLGNPPPSYG